MAQGTLVEAARKYAGMTQVAAGKIASMSNVTFAAKEKNPGRFTLDEFFALYHEMDDGAQSIMWSQLEEMRDKFCN